MSLIKSKLESLLPFAFERASLFDIEKRLKNTNLKRSRRSRILAYLIRDYAGYQENSHPENSHQSNSLLMNFPPNNSHREISHRKIFLPGFFKFFIFCIFSCSKSAEVRLVALYQKKF